MIVPLSSNRKTAKARFFAAYALSLLLILVLFSFFFKPASGSVGNLLASSDKDEEPHAAIYNQLHQRMDGLDQICARVANDKSPANLEQLQRESTAFFSKLDSLRNTVASLPNSGREKELTALLEAFSRAAEKQVSLAKGLPLEDDNLVGPAEQKSLLEQKEQRILALENENRQLLQEKEKLAADLQNAASVPVQASQRTVAGGTEWKEKYDKLKAVADRLKQSNDQYLSQSAVLRKSYKDVVDDNRRLLAQLQAARAGRN